MQTLSELLSIHYPMKLVREETPKGTVFTVFLVDIPTCNASGSTLAEAFNRLDAITPALFATLREKGFTFPAPSKSVIVESVTVSQSAPSGSPVEFTTVAA